MSGPGTYSAAERELAHRPCHPAPCSRAVGTKFSFFGRRRHDANRNIPRDRHDLRRLHQQGDARPDAVPGVGDVKVELSAGEATVQYDERLTSPPQLKSAVTNAGYGVDSTNPDAGVPTSGGCCGGSRDIS